MQNKILVVVTLALLIPASAWTQQKGAIELKSIAEVEVTEKNDKGEKVVKRVDVSKAVKAPGDIVIFTTRYTNTGNKPATNIVITNPVPEHMIYMDRSAEGGNTRIEYSVDGGKTYGMPEKLNVKNADRTVRNATAADYTHIRWTVIKPFTGGGTDTVSFRARIK